MKACSLIRVCWLLSPNHFRGHVERGAYFAVLAGATGVLLELLGESKVNDFDFTVLIGSEKKDVFRFEVSVHDPQVVHICDSREELAHDPLHAGFCDGA